MRLILLLMLLPGLLLAQDERAPVPAWYAGVKGGIVSVDGAQESDDGSLFGLELGRNFSGKWSMELEATLDSADLLATGVEVDRQTLQFNLIKVNRIPLWNPYFLMGVGAQRIDAGADNDTDMLLAVAVGGLWNLNNTGLMLRVEGRYRYSLENSDLIEPGEPVVTVGLVFPLGL